MPDGVLFLAGVVVILAFIVFGDVDLRVGARHRRQDSFPAPDVGASEPPAPAAVEAGGAGKADLERKIRAGLAYQAEQDALQAIAEWQAQQ